MAAAVCEHVLIQLPRLFSLGADGVGGGVLLSTNAEAACAGTEGVHGRGGRAVHRSGGGVDRTRAGPARIAARRVESGNSRRVLVSVQGSRLYLRVHVVAVHVSAISLRSIDVYGLAIPGAAFDRERDGDRPRAGAASAIELARGAGADSGNRAHADRRGVSSGDGREARTSSSRRRGRGGDARQCLIRWSSTFSRRWQ